MKIYQVNSSTISAKDGANGLIYTIIVTEDKIEIVQNNKARQEFSTATEFFLFWVLTLGYSRWTPVLGTDDLLHDWVFNIKPV